MPRITPFLALPPRKNCHGTNKQQIPCGNDNKKDNSKNKTSPLQMKPLWG
ncbi:hypothetical protein AciX8_0103 [Granulicella mallensis MP5ACTX8]|uniref:Uncharacterized protein n=1 Tax=Granulicella mallensis (strain ATCC BAA-1857 / DSM 23137 / MP5ACTX8) TaxID=682795 RepID=G8NYP8_GRAMM|nr:hypothetical protein AciX8_0103 [Granulicella mallensis MP5ACTX8]